MPEWQVAGYQRERTGAMLPNVSPSNVYPTTDGDLVLIAANQDSVFRRLAEVMGRPELAADERYATHGARGTYMEELDGLIADLDGHPRRPTSCSSALHAGGVPAGRIYRARDMFADPHFAAREAIVRVVHPELGEFPMQNVSPGSPRAPARSGTSGRELGEHNDEV